MNLQELIADAMQRKKTRGTAKRKSRVKPEDAYRRTKEELAQMKLDACIPTELHLRVTVQTCECGERFESINSTPLVKRVSPALTHYESVGPNVTDALKYNDLPRFIVYRRINVPWCTTCFANAREVEADAL